MTIRVLLVICLTSILFGCNSGNVKSGSSGSGSITIYPNKEVLVGIKIENDKVVGVSQVSEGGQITFKLSEFSANGMMLSGKNTLSNTVKYDIYMIDYKGKEHYTSSCPMMAGVGVFESWGHKIPKMVISNFRVLPDGGDSICQ